MSRPMRHQLRRLPVPRPICVPCRVEMRCEKNGVLVNDPQVGYLDATYWHGDKYKCPACGHEIVTGFGAPVPGPLTVHAAVPEDESIQFEYQVKP